MIPNPIHKVLSTLSTNQVRYLLMGGQACVLYGATEFSRDCDIVILCDPQNLDRLRSALQEMDARPIAVPVLSVENLQRGHAVHFRCHAPKTLGIRLDVMAVLRGVAQFDELWSRRTTIGVDGANQFNLMGLPDLVSAKKTQRDKDWPMIRRLVEAHYQQRKEIATDDHVRFWLRESRTPAMLIELAKKHPTLALEVASDRPLLESASRADRHALQAALVEEERIEREADRVYWEPLKRELEKLRSTRRKGQ